MNQGASNADRVAPRVVALAGPNGAGKTTTASAVLQGALDLHQFVNADQIALGLSGFAPESAAIEAARTMLLRLHELADQRADFAFETTLASRSFAPWLKSLIASGYEFHLVFLWLPTAELAIGRVADRVRRGGHDVPEVTIRRRYVRGLRNFFDLYQPLASTWQMLNNTGIEFQVIANGRGQTIERVRDGALWQAIKVGLEP